MIVSCHRPVVQVDVNWHQNLFIRFHNIVFTSLVTDERTDRRTNERTGCLRLTVCLGGDTKAEPFC